MKGVISTGYFRTGSTFFFSCMREIKEFKCFYEPFHPDILKYITATIDGGMAVDNESLGHTLVDDYFEEFKGIDIEEMEKRLSFRATYTNHPVKGAKSKATDIKNYIDFLIEQASSSRKIPVLQANRFNLMLPWLKENYNEYLLVYITRKPSDVFHSLVSMGKKDGVEVSIDTKNTNFWNTEEVFKNILSYYSLNFVFKENLNFYQKLYFNIRFCDLFMSPHADVVVKYDNFYESSKSVILNISNAIGADGVGALKFINDRFSSPKVRTMRSNLNSLEMEVDYLLNKVNPYFGGKVCYR